MNLFTGEAADELFSGEPPAAVRDWLHQAAEAPRDQVPALLWTAQACAPQALSVYYLLYKCHAGRREFELAERAALGGLAQAALQAGLPQDWCSVRPGDADFQGTGPARFWLFTLKALAFIRIRSGRPAEARPLLDHLTLLDPQATAGGGVVALLLQAAPEA